MSEQAFKIYEKALKDRHARNEARRIRSRVGEARKSPHMAGARWPFELLQNALDAGPRPGSDTVTITFRQQDQKLVFQHDGAPFTSSELTALLTGGSSKEFESEETTGRYGTGFLVTHVLAEKVDVEGLLAVGSGYERFQFTLDRSGDEEAIIKNTEACGRAVRAAVPVATVDGISSAGFEYLVDSADSLALGLGSFRNALPYLYATRFGLGHVTIQIENGNTEEWLPSSVEPSIRPDGLICHRDICVNAGDEVGPRKMRVLRFITRPEAHAAALVLIQEEASGWTVTIPDVETPHIYREYPIRGSTFLPTNFIFDGKFDTDQERGRLLMSATDKELLTESFQAALVGVRKAVDLNGKSARLAMLRCADRESLAFRKQFTLEILILHGFATAYFMAN